MHTQVLLRMIGHRPIIVSTIVLATASSLAAQNTVQIPLNYNFNGIVHSGESGQPDSPNGFRAISDRALDFRGGVPNSSVLNRYLIVATPGALDIVHLGNRDTVDGGNWRFDGSPDGDNVGTRPSWLPNANQSGPQVTTLAQPVSIGSNSEASVLFQISNGGGSFDVTFGFASGASRTEVLSGGDWFGGAFAGCDSVDRANAGNNLNLVEQTVGLGSNAGEELVSITFSNRSNNGAGYAILGVNVEEAPSVSRINNVPLNYNFNGIVHFNEGGRPDDPNGFRSISDRALDFSGGIPSDAVLSRFSLVETPGVLDIVHVGNRDTVNGGQFGFDPAPDADNLGTRPAWLSNPDQTGPQTTVLAEPILLDTSSEAVFLFQVSNGGGLLDVTFTFGLGTQGSITATLDGADWFGGPYTGTDSIDSGTSGGSLRLTEQRIDLGMADGLVLTEITFSNPSNPNAGYAVVAANVIGCLACANQGNITDLGGASSAGATLSVEEVVPLGCDLVWTVSGATPMSPGGLFGIDLVTNPIPLSILSSSCDGTFTLRPLATVPIPIDATGSSEFSLPVPTSSSLCGVTIFTQYIELRTSTCPVSVSNALGITIGN